MFDRLTKRHCRPRASRNSSAACPLVSASRMRRPPSPAPRPAGRAIARADGRSGREPRQSPASPAAWKTRRAPRPGQGQDFRFPVWVRLVCDTMYPAHDPQAGAPCRIHFSRQPTGQLRNADRQAAAAPVAGPIVRPPGHRRVAAACSGLGEVVVAHAGNRRARSHLAATGTIGRLPAVVADVAGVDVVQPGAAGHVVGRRECLRQRGRTIRQLKSG